MAELNQQEPPGGVLLAAIRNTPVASRMAMRFARAGCRVSALYPSKSHPLASTRAVASHHTFGAIDPLESLLTAMAESCAGLVVPCDGMSVRHMHALYATLSATPEGTTAAAIIERSLGDPTAYLLIDSRHEIQTAARAEGLNAAESFAIGRATDPDMLAKNLPFPWVLKADYSWGGRGTRVAHNMSEARSFIRVAGASPSLAVAAKQILVNGDRAALAEWLHARRSGLSVQRPVAGTRAMVVAACWRGAVLALISVEVLSPATTAAPPALVRIIENQQMEKTVRQMAGRLGLSGFHSFDFVIERESGESWLTEFNAHCAGPAHLNAGAGHDLVDALCGRWLGSPPPDRAPVHPGPLVAYFPQAWAFNPSDPILETGAFDIPADDPDFVKRVKEIVMRDRKYMKFKSGLRSLFFLNRRR